MNPHLTALAADHWHHSDGPWFLIPIAFWLLVIAFFWRLRSRHHGHHQGWGSTHALDEAFAKGEITAEDYRSRMDTIRDVHDRRRRR